MNTVPTAVVGASLLYEWYCKATTQASIFHLKATARITCGIATAAAVFLLAMEYLLVADFNQVLVVTVLGKQVRAVLEGSQLALLMLILAAALLTVGLCTRLLLRARREEIVLLARVGWDQRFVILRMLWDNWKLALLSGEVGVLIALGVTMLGGASPSLLVGAVLVFSGPLLALMLVSIVALGPVWQETKRVYAWR